MTQQQPEKSILYNIPVWVSGLGAFAIVLSVTYDFAFFWVFNLGFSELATSLSDHLRSSLIVIPVIVLYIFISSIIVMLEKKIRKVKKSDKAMAQLKKLSASPKYSERMFSKLGIYYHNIVPGLAVGSPVIIFTLIIGVPMAWVIIIGITVTSSVPYLFVFNRLIKPDQFTREFYFILKWIPHVMYLTFVFGLLSANYVKVCSDDFIFELKQGKSKQLTLVRAFENYFVTWQQEQQEINFIKTEDVLSYYPENSNKLSKKKYLKISKNLKFYCLEPQAKLK